MLSIFNSYYINDIQGSRRNFLDKFNKCYIKILTLNKKPDNSPLKENIRELPSDFTLDYDCHCQPKPHCLFAFINPNTGNFIQSDEIE